MKGSKEGERMIEGFKKVIQDSNVATKERYKGKPVYFKDGIAYCEMCDSPKQSPIWFGDKEGIHGDWRMVGHLCKCEELQRDASSDEKRNRIKKEYMDRLKTKGIQDEAMRCQTFEADNGKQENMAIAKSYAKSFKEDFLPTGLGFTFWGDVGTGKTFTASCIANYLTDRNIPVLMTSFSRIMNEVWNAKDKDGYYKAFNKYDLLIIDDLGVERSTDYAMEQVYTVIDERIRSKKPMLITTNLTIKQLKNPDNLQMERIYSRILQVCAPIAFKGENLRELESREQLDFIKSKIK